METGSEDCMKCSFSGVGRSKCSAVGEERARLPVWCCRKNTEGHLKSMKLWEDIEEWQLLVNRGGFEEQSLDELTVCPRHRIEFGLGFVPSRHCCYADHRGRRGAGVTAPRGCRRVSLKLSREVKTLRNVILPVGAVFCGACRRLIYARRKEQNHGSAPSEGPRELATTDTSAARRRKQLQGQPEVKSLEPDGPNMAKADDIEYKLDWDLEATLTSIMGNLQVESVLANAFQPVNIALKQQERLNKDVDSLYTSCAEQLAKVEKDILDEEKFMQSQITSSRSPAVIPEVLEGEMLYVPNVQKATPTLPPTSQSVHRTQVITSQPSTIKSLLMSPTKPAKSIVKQITPPSVNKISMNAPKQSPSDDVTIISAPPGKINITEPRKIIVPQMTVGLKILGRKHNEIWYRGTLLEIQSKELPPEERRYRMKFDGKGAKTLKGTEIAYADLALPYLPVGSRVVALYHDPEGVSSNYAGIVAEPPSVRNSQRFLIFFDDGYAQYCLPKQVSKVYYQSRNVWEDIHEDSQDFIREYLQQYPDRPMVRLQKGQVVKTEWTGKWWTARVTEVDASLVKMFFEADKRTEWIYRGSTRLGPLYTELANAEQARQTGKGRHKHFQAKSSKKPFVEYTRLDEEKKALPTVKQPEPLKIVKQVAKKSTTKQGLTDLKKQDFEASSVSINKTGRDMVSILQERLASGATIDEMSGDRMDIDVSLPYENKPRKKFVSHKCRHSCLKDSDDDPAAYKGYNPLLIPLLCGWERQVTKSKAGKRTILYRAPCARRLRSIDELDKYLMITNSKLTIDLFSYDGNLHVNKEFVPIKTFCDIKDLSYGKENVPISCVNGVDRQYPDYVEYSNQRLPAKGVKLNLDKDFLLCCSCTDGCRDKSKCECWQLTHEAFMAANKGEKDPTIGYVHRRLSEQVITGIYECNERCHCDARCTNKVAQNGLQLRLQVFKTEKRGWGLRCLDDIPNGGFICIYAGQLLTEQGANEDGQAYGDEYLAELDYIEVVENVKEGYEEDVEDDEGLGKETEGSSSSEEDDDDEDTFSANTTESSASARDLPTFEREISTRRKTKGQQELEKAGNGKDSPKVPGWDAQEGSSAKRLKNTAEWVNKIPTLTNDVVIVDSDDEGENNQSQESMETSLELPDVLGTKATTDNTNPGTLISDLVHQEHGGIPKLRIKRVGSDSAEKDAPSGGISGLKIGEIRTDAEIEEEPDEEVGGNQRTTRSKNKSQFLMTPQAQREAPAAGKKEDEERRPMRSYFGSKEMCYIMDAKSIGNIGRYLNHNCSPNVFVQNVFVDTHDLRFPWVAFFASQYIRAGTELTWDYNYEVGSVPGKILYCYCGAADCRGRLL